MKTTQRRTYDLGSHLIKTLCSATTETLNHARQAQWQMPGPSEFSEIPTKNYETFSSPIFGPSSN